MLADDFIHFDTDWTHHTVDWCGRANLFENPNSCSAAWQLPLSLYELTILFLIFSYARWEKGILTKETWLAVTIVLKVLLVYRMTTPFCQFCLVFFFFLVISNLFFFLYLFYFCFFVFFHFWLSFPCYTLYSWQCCFTCLELVVLLESSLLHTCWGSGFLWEGEIEIFTLYNDSNNCVFTICSVYSRFIYKKKMIYRYIL